MTTTRNLEDDINSVWKIYFHAKDSFEIFKYLSINEARGKFWRHVHLISFKDCVIGLDKLVSNSKNQKFRLESLMNKLDQNGIYSKYNMDWNKLEKWRSDLKKNTQVIQDITTLRSKLYAHSDPNAIETYLNYPVKKDDFESLFKFLEEFIFDVNKNCLNSHSIMTTNLSSEKISILEEIEELKKYKENLKMRDK